MIERLSVCEYRALITMATCPHSFALKAQLGRGVGETTLNNLVNRGLAMIGASPEQPGSPGWAIAPLGRQALDTAKTVSKRSLGNDARSLMQIQRQPAPTPPCTTFRETGPGRRRPVGAD
ncbi:hypothetical protein [Muricoccus radiodurans]|uniref:hypothetical protein n=1 Tax=Muricoccus radiodurans TaxID=2231721 RepID=UPI003CEACFC5